MRNPQRLPTGARVCKNVSNARIMTFGYDADVIKLGSGQVTNSAFRGSRSRFVRKDGPTARYN